MAMIDDLNKSKLKKDSIILINKRLNKYRNSEIPIEKIEKVNKLLQNCDIKNLSKFTNESDNSNAKSKQ